MKTLEQLVVPFRIDVKAASAQPNARTFEGLLAVWDLDLGNDRIKKGAFSNTLKQWKASGEALPLLNSHTSWDVFAAMGQLLDAKETNDGLWTKWEVIEGPDGDALLTRLRPSKTNGRAVVGKMSIGYEPVKFSFEQPPDSTNPWDRIRNLEEIKLREGSVVLFPMAPGASIDASTVKSVLDMARNTDPSTLSPEMKQNLRRLTSRIGRLLKQAPGIPSPTPSPHATTPDPTPPTPTPTPTPTPAPSPTPSPAPAPTPAPATDAPSPSVKGDDATPDTKTDAEPVYLFSEALTQRLRKNLLRNKVSNL